MKTIMGTLRQSAGTVQVGNQDVKRAAANAAPGPAWRLFPQGRQIFPKLTIEENLRVASKRGPTVSE